MNILGRTARLQQPSASALTKEIPMRSRQRVLTLATSAWLVAIATVDAQIATSTTGTRESC
jgi:hypothetical protein